MNMDCLEYWKHAQEQWAKEHVKLTEAASRLPEIKMDAELIESMTKTVEEIKKISIPPLPTIRFTGVAP